MAYAKLVYFARPIDQTGGHWVEPHMVNPLAVRYGWVLYRPFGAWHNAAGDPRVQPANNQVLDRADGLLAVWPTGVPSVGVPMEIQRALSRGIPVAVCRTAPTTALIGSGAGLFNLDEVEKAAHWLDQEMLLGVTPESGAGVARVAGPGQMPTQAYPDDAGFDLYCAESVILEPGVVYNVACLVAIEWPSDVWGLLLGRSSTFHKRGLLVNTAVIDPGYRGDLFCCVRNVSAEMVRIEAGDRLAQIIPMPLLAPSIRLQQVDHLAEHPRGAQGFGSSGR